MFVASMKKGFAKMIATLFLTVMVCVHWCIWVICGTCKVAKNDKFLSDVRRKRATCLVDVHVEVRSDGHQPLASDSCVEPRFVCGCGVMVGHCSGRPRDACVGEFHLRANYCCRPMAVLLGAITVAGRLC